MAAVTRVRIPVRATFYSQWQYLNKFESEQSCILYVPKAFLNIGADSLVVMTSRCVTRVRIPQRANFFSQWQYI